MRIVRIPSAALPLVVVVALAWYLLSAPAYGAQLGRRALNMTNNAVSSQSIYNLVFDLSTAGTLGSIKMQFCANDPTPGDPCTVPAGLDVSTASLAAQAGATGFTVSGASTANQIILTRTAVAAVPGRVSYTFNPVKNPSTPGSYYVRLQTYASTDASGTASDYGGIAYAITNNISITAEVPPYLIFCTGITIGNYNCVNAIGDYIDFGELSSTHTSSASSQMLVATNAVQGYAISSSGTTLTSGNNVITALATGDVSRPGTAQFGFNLRANTTPIDGVNVNGPGISQPAAAYDQPNVYQFNPGDTLVTDSNPDNIREYTSSYIVNVPKAQAPGIYVSTVTYICLANF
jgi:hypothetical protein